MLRAGLAMALGVLALAACQGRANTPSTAVETLPPAPTHTSAPPVETATAPPSPEPACPGAPPTRLIVGEWGRVLANDPRPINVRDGPGTTHTRLGAIAVNERFFVLEGPLCEDEYAWFRVAYGDVEGWIAEGDLTSYYVEPFLPG